MGSNNNLAQIIDSPLKVNNVYIDYTSVYSEQSSSFNHGY